VDFGTGIGEFAYKSIKSVTKDAVWMVELVLVCSKRIKALFLKRILVLNLLSEIGSNTAYI
jgi:hypothetical protein